MSGNSVFGENVKNKKEGKVFGGASIVSRNEDALFGQAVNNNQNGVKTVGVGKGFNEVHGDRIPRTRRNRKLL